MSWARMPKAELLMEEQERQWGKERRSQGEEWTKWDDEYKYVATVEFEFKLRFETTGRHKEFKEIIRTFFERIAEETGVKVRIVKEYYNLVKKRKRWEISLHFIIGVPSKQFYDDIFGKYCEVTQTIHDLQYEHLEPKLPQFEVTYEYYKEFSLS